MKRDQHKNFMEKKIKRTAKGTKSGSYSSEEKTIIITILVAIVIIGALLLNLVFKPGETEPFSAIYYLDSEKQTTNLPKTVVLGENSTFSLWVGVENQNYTMIDYQVWIKMDDGKGLLNHTSTEYIQSIEERLEPLAHGETWEFLVPINI
ncbi:DUF1616 domain-containing protein, partial [Candidatus Bathyarchaeota archaeon]|nr:DUF1616 domain-containing protein [Candidatus Bathyarchaeota archaeon]